MSAARHVYLSVRRHDGRGIARWTLHKRDNQGQWDGNVSEHGLHRQSVGLRCFWRELRQRLSRRRSIPSVAKARVKHLLHETNLSHWFAQAGGAANYPKEHFENLVSAEDIALIKAMGFDHVRLSVNPQPMWRHNEADAIPTEYLGYLDAAVKMILDKNLAVVIDIHPEGDFKKALSSDASVEQFAYFWRGLAKHYSSWDPDRVFFESLNESEMRDHYRWNGILARLAVAIREGAAQQTIIVEGARWADDDDLMFMEPPRDANVIYNFHFYEPHLFTHQGATWGRVIGTI